MKKILVLTDFSTGAAYAAEFAIHIARSTGASILIAHIIEPINQFVDDTVFDLIEKETDAIINENMIQLKKIEDNLNKILSAKGISNHQIEITKTVSFGKLSVNAKKLVEENSIDLVVVGSRKSNSLSRFFLGSKTHTLLDHIKCPILLIPESLKFEGIHNITYATDLPLNNKKALQFLGNFAKHFNAKITVNHLSKVSFPEKKSEETIEKSINDQLGDSYSPILYHTIKSNDVVLGLLETLGNHKVDILVMVHKKYQKLQGLLHVSLSKKMADHSFVPLLILPNSYVSEDDIFTDSQLDHFCFGTSDTL